MSKLIGTTLVDRIEFMENDLIDDKYIVYKYKIRVVIKNNIMISVVFTVGQEVPDDVLNIANLGKYQLSTLSRIESPISSSHEVPEQRYVPNFIILTL